MNTDMDAGNNPALNTLLNEGTGIEPKPVVPENHNSGIRRSETVGKLVKALCDAQLEFAPVVKSNINPQFKSKYADLATIINATMPALAKHGLAVIQTPKVNGRELTMTTLLVHSSDEWMANDLTMPATMRNELTAQTIGSACTYSRRYALQSMLGIAADVDDDATEASGGGTQEAANAVAARKIAEHEAKKSIAAGHIPSLFYTVKQEEDGQKAYVTGDKQLLSDNKELLAFKGKWSNKAYHFAMDANDLDDLKYELEQRKVPFVKLP